MKNQEQLNQDYDKIMIDFKQKAFIEAALKKESRLEEFVSYVYKEFSNHFNDEYKHIYLKPLTELCTQNKLSVENDKKQSFFTVSKCLPSTFWNTELGERTAIEQANLSIHNIFSLQVNEERTKFYREITSKDYDIASPVLELSNTDKIKIQENYSDFIESFLNSPLLSENIKLNCFKSLHQFLSHCVDSKTYQLSSMVNFSNQIPFIQEVISSAKINNIIVDGHESKILLNTLTPYKSFSPKL